MSDKITSSQIFLFLSQQANWKEEADTNKKDPLTKGEMREYLNSEEFKDFAGVKIQDVSAKTFNDFWAALDANVNNNRLDEKELDRANVQIAIVKHLKNIVSKESLPQGLTDNARWQTELLDALNNTVMGSISSIGFDVSVEDITEEYVSNLIANDLESAKTTAMVQCFIAKYESEYANLPAIKELKNSDNYLLTDDKDLQKIIKAWIEQNTATDATQIDAAVKALIEGYLATAGIGSGDVSVLEGNSAYKPSRLNELQMAQMKKEAKAIFGGSLKDKASNFSIEGVNGAIDLTGGGYDGIYKKYVDEFLVSYFESGYKNATRADGQSLFDAALNELRTKGMELFKASKAGEKFTTEVQFADNYRFAWEGKDFFKEIVGSGIDGVGEDGSIKEGSDLANLKAWLNADAGEGKFPEYYEAYNKILNSIMNPYDNTYRKSDGSINYDKINKELLEIVKVKFGIVTKTGSADSVDSTQTAAATTIDWSGLTDNNYSYSSYIVSYNDGGANSKVNHNTQVSANLQYYYNCGGRLNLLGTLQCDNNDGFTANGKYDWLTAIGTAKTNFSGFVDTMKNACAASGKYDSAALEIAANKVKSLYNMAFDGAPNNWAGKKSTNAPDENGNGGPSFVFDGESYNYGIKKWYEEDTACAERHEGGKLGLVFAEAYKKTTFQISVDLKTVMDLFAKFYEAAVGA